MESVHTLRRAQQWHVPQANWTPQTLPQPQPQPSQLIPPTFLAVASSSFCIASAASAASSAAFAASSSHSSPSLLSLSLSTRCCLPAAALPRPPLPPLAAALLPFAFALPLPLAAAFALDPLASCSSPCCSSACSSSSASSWRYLAFRRRCSTGHHSRAERGAASGAHMPVAAGMALLRP